MRPELRALLIVACVGAMSCIQVVQPPPEKRVPVPDKIESPTDPVLEPTEYAGILADEDFVVPIYYSEESEQWYRWSFNRWYVAFSWDGNWFPLPKDEVPELLVKVSPPPTQIEVVDELEKLERELERIDSLDQLPTLPDDPDAEPGPTGYTSIEDQLEELERQMREIEEREAGSDPNAPASDAPADP